VKKRIEDAETAVNAVLAEAEDTARLSDASVLKLRLASQQLALAKAEAEALPGAAATHAPAKKASKRK
jgi:hypothetical protein